MGTLHYLKKQILIATRDLVNDFELKILDSEFHIHLLLQESQRFPKTCKNDGEVEDLDIGKCMETFNVRSGYF